MAKKSERSPARRSLAPKSSPSTAPLTPAPPGAVEKAAAPDPLAARNEIFRALGLRLGLPLLAGWLFAAFFRHWVGFAIMGAVTLAAAGLVVWALGRMKKSQQVAEILKGLEPTDKAGRQAAIEKLDASFKKDDIAASMARAQLMMQDDPEKALTELEGINIEKILPAEADQVRFQRALIHLAKGEVDKARQLVDHIDLSRHTEPKSRAAMAAIVAEAWARTGQARKGQDILDLYNPDDPAYVELKPQLFRARAFAAAALNDMKQVRRNLKRLASENPQYLQGFLAKKVHPLLSQEAKLLYMQSGAMPRRVQYQRR